MYAVLLCIYLKFYVSMHSDMHVYGCTHTLSNVLLCVQRLEPNGSKKDCNKLEQRNCQKLQKLQLQKKTHVNQHLFFDKRQKKTHNLLQVFFVKKPRPRSWKLCIEGGPCELMRLQKQKAWEATKKKKNVVNHGGKILISKRPVVVDIMYSLLHFQFWLVDLSHFHF